MGVCWGSGKAETDFFEVRVSEERCSVGVSGFVEGSMAIGEGKGSDLPPKTRKEVQSACSGGRLIKPVWVSRNLSGRSGEAFRLRPRCRRTVRWWG